MNIDIIRECCLFWKILNSSLVFDMNQVLQSSPIFGKLTTGYILHKFNEIIDLTFRTQDGCSPILIRVHSNVKFHKIFAIYSNLKGIDPENYRYIFSGKIIDLETTPFDNELRSGNTIDVVLKLSGC